jgi:probable F420-dependent oxidoreductase
MNRTGAAQAARPASNRIRLAVFCSHVDELVGTDGRNLVTLAERIEKAGADQIVLSEHVVLAERIEAHGPGGLPFPFPPDHVYPEPLITLAAIAGATSDVRLATGILIAPLRPAVVLAKMAATLDHLSGGRLDLGVGAGWHRAELLAAGVDPARATEVLEDTVGACRALWSGGPVSFRSASVEFDELHCHPLPVQGAALPVWFAGPSTRSTFERIVRLGDGWVPFGNTSADEIARGNDLMRACAERQGGDPSRFGIRASLPVPPATDRTERLDAALAAAAGFVAAGATVLQLPLHRLATDMDEATEVVERAARVVADLRPAAS